MSSKPRETLALEAELIRLNALVRERRQQLARLKACPNPECPCRVVWKNKVEEGLAEQMRKIGKQVNHSHGTGKTLKKRKKVSVAKRQKQAA
jgi:hypothetical protein